MTSSEIIKAIGEVRDKGYSVLRNHFAFRLVDACREAFWPRMTAYLESGQPPNRGPHRHFIAMPFEPPCFAPQFFFDPDVLSIVRGLMDDRIVADQWGCDVPLLGSEYQNVHVDYQRPLFPEAPDLELPAYALVVSFGWFGSRARTALWRLRQALIACREQKRFALSKTARLQCSRYLWKSETS